ncbi:hypothetical protein HF295_05280 [Hujiaoplasma nucleasis]|uniref:Uncharacterized protein n=1 Tax=Hujiaoplasma nucleasis TaxID=2725268 RepID=A0A7L6N6Z1_9MOLU|nr:hypothetical protein [Hujiaoplasma nucleasis]QLY40304.1 hypothetical protein HF295_05280 [Hujiaoplasma nucleasis]
MRKKLLFFISILFLLFSLLACSTMNQVEKDFNKYGYEVKIINDDYNDDFNATEALENIYGVYDSKDLLVARLYEFSSSGALDKFIEDAGGEFPGTLRNKELLMFSEVGDYAVLTLIFFGHDPNEFLNR